MEFLQCDSSQVPLELLLEADPSEQSIASYLHDSWCFIAKEPNEVFAACVMKVIRDGVVEIFNVSVSPCKQQQGIGTQLLRHVIAQMADKGINRLELGTGTFGYQLTYYQRLGFRVDCVLKNYFLDNYPEAIFENGIQHQDMLRLYLNLEE
ncbi:GNAT family N-acetyltransferase [Vibrio ponticus]|uniref:GNAT family N-acetyltransferase n=1 Tax=Vibrio ponticus TaxID=265668 RepID=A0ABX3FMA6_9VIBR|nr:GNAT family N-acetyltransferase [Vibrio ponticus]OLQ94329.1 GNAT family N-acetyltransferase [Vibrio ponticus]